MAIGELLGQCLRCAWFLMIGRQTVVARVGDQLTLLYPRCTLVAVHKMCFDMLRPHRCDFGWLRLRLLSRTGLGEVTLVSAKHYFLIGYTTCCYLHPRITLGVEAVRKAGTLLIDIPTLFANLTHVHMQLSIVEDSCIIPVYSGRMP